ncbi:peroxiredoxin [Cerasicoccus arenae]|uniref:thioredoxin-dependent peroxiredoxin n=1 Tax=Cerasicoccus arenae TaxID=424488 RepID=A0A8J3GD26_9BACT|nr:peroxiredoxin [Cerasicoccus arenae]MBK1859799.1 peroxiredoxin [Cerasicoccus arenae]GHB93746.1 hypothetical protein GCM10007047_06580 [Cerasicoccus arenae]
MFRSIISFAGALLVLASVNCAAEELKLGAELPAVTVLDENGAEVNLGDYADKPYLLVYFYPKANTGGCTKQGCSLRDAYTELTAMGVTVIGVSTDSPEAQKSFKDKNHFPFTLLADQKAEVAGAFGVPMMGNFTSRQAYLFANGKLVWLDKKASTQKQADDVKAAISELSS